MEVLTRNRADAELAQERGRGKGGRESQQLPPAPPPDQGREQWVRVGI